MVDNRFNFLGSGIEDVELDTQVEELLRSQLEFETSEIPVTLVGEWPDPFDEVLGG